MAQELNATCDICGKKYALCQSCKEIKTYTPWRVVTDTLPHYTIFLAVSSYTKNKDKEVAREMLKKCDLSDLDTFNENIKCVIKEIMTEPQQARRIENEIATNNGEEIIQDNLKQNTRIKKKY